MVTIDIKKETRAKLKQKWQHGNDTYDKVINRLLEEVHEEIDAVSTSQETGKESNSEERGKGDA